MSLEQHRRILLDFDCDSITAQVERALDPYVRNSLFHPEAMARASASASRACAWVLGMLEARKWRAGRGHERLDRLAYGSPASSADIQKSVAVKSGIRHKSAMHNLSRGGVNIKETASFFGRLGAGSLCTSISNLYGSTPPHTASRIPPLRDWSSALAEPTIASQTENSMITHSSRLQFVQTVDLSPVEFQAVSPKQNPFSLKCTQSRQNRVMHSALTQKERVARLVTQRRQMERLASRPQDELMNSFDKSQEHGNQKRRMFICSDGSTALPYEILGEPSLELANHCFVVAHDLFDTLDASKIFFKLIGDKIPGCQILVYNYAGQAGTSFSADKSGGISAVMHAQHLAELVQHVDICGEMLLSTSPFFFIGIGYGLNICAQLLNRVDKHQDTLKGIVSINGASHDPAASNLESTGAILTCCPSPSHSHLLIVTDRGTMHILSVDSVYESGASPSASCVVESHFGPVTGMCEINIETCQTSHLVTAGVDGTVRLWDTAVAQCGSYQFWSEASTDPKPEAGMSKSDVTGTGTDAVRAAIPITSVASSPHHPILGIGLASGIVYFMHIGLVKDVNSSDLIEIVPLANLQLYKQPVTALVFHPTEMLLAVACSLEQGVYIINIDPNSKHPACGIRLSLLGRSREGP